MRLLVPTWFAHPNGGFYLLAPCHLTPEKPIFNIPCVLGSVVPEGRRWRWERRSLARTWWPYPHWRGEQEIEGTAWSIDRAMMIVEEGLTKGRAERPGMARTG